MAVGALGSESWVMSCRHVLALDSGGTSPSPVPARARCDPGPGASTYPPLVPGRVAGFEEAVEGVDLVVWGVLPGAVTLVGGAIVIGAGLFLIRREAVSRSRDDEPLP